MIPLSSLGLLPALSLYVGALLSSNATLACIYPPCTDSLVAAPIQPGSGAGAATRACEVQPGTSACRTGVALRAVSDVPRKVEHRRNFPPVQPKVSGLIDAVLFASSERKERREKRNNATFNQIFVCIQSEVLIYKLKLNPLPRSLSRILSAASQQVLSHRTVYTLNLAPPNSHGAMTAIKEEIKLGLL